MHYKETLRSVTRWLEEIRGNTADELEKLLVGNKCDMVDMRAVTTDEGRVGSYD